MRYVKAIFATPYAVILTVKVTFQNIKAVAPVFISFCFRENEWPWKVKLVTKITNHTGGSTTE